MTIWRRWSGADNGMWSKCWRTRASESAGLGRRSEEQKERLFQLSFQFFLQNREVFLAKGSAHRVGLRAVAGPTGVRPVFTVTGAVP